MADFFEASLFSDRDDGTRARPPDLGVDLFAVSRLVVNFENERGKR